MDWRSIITYSRIELQHALRYCQSCVQIAKLRTHERYARWQLEQTFCRLGEYLCANKLGNSATLEQIRTTESEQAENAEFHSSGAIERKERAGLILRLAEDEVKRAGDSSSNVHIAEAAKAQNSVSEIRKLLRAKYDDLEQQSEYRRSAMITLGGVVMMVCLVIAIALPRSAHESTMQNQRLTADTRTLEKPSPSPATPEDSPDKHLVYPGNTSITLVATHEDRTYGTYLRRFADHNVPSKDWNLIGLVQSAVGAYADLSIEVHANECFPASSAAPFHKLEGVVRECSEIVGIAPPAVYLLRDSTPRAWCDVSSDGSSIFVTSELLSLFDQQPEELRFVIGRELGHLKSHPHDMLRIGRSFISLLDKMQGVLLEALPATAVATKALADRPLSNLVTGRLVSWCRSTEFTADRYGLLCCQDLHTAQSALWRFVHGVPSTNYWIDQRRVFDSKKIMAEIQTFESMPLDSMLRRICKEKDGSNPFIHERIAAITQWAESTQYTHILQSAKPDSRLSLTFKELGIRGVDTNSSISFKIYKGGSIIFSQPVTSVSNGQLFNLDTDCTCSPNEPMFIELWQTVPTYLGFSSEHKCTGVSTIPYDGTSATYPMQVMDVSDADTSSIEMAIRVKKRTEKETDL